MQGSTTLYVRKATGLVREISLFDSIVMNVAFINIALGALTVTVAPWSFPGANLIVTMVATTLLCIFPAVVYSIFASAMPRSGGDYLYIGRVLHPVLGFVMNFNTIAAMTFFTGLLCTWVSNFALSEALVTMGTVLNNPTLVSWSTTAAGKPAQLVIGTITIALFTWLVAAGTKITFRVTAIILGLMFLAQVVTMLVLAGADHNAFVSAFNGYASYDKVLAQAKADGFPIPVGFSWAASLGAMPIAFSSLGYAIVSCYVAGEVKSARRTSMPAMIGSLLISGAVLTLICALATRTFGNDFLGAIGYLGANDAKHYPLTSPPFFYLFVSMLTKNVPILMIIGVGFVLAIVTAVPPTFMFATRSIFAWSFDQYFPATFAEVNERTHTPIKATLLVGIYMWVTMNVFIWAPGTWTTFVFSLGIASLETFLVVAIAGIVFPWRRPDLYRAAPYAVSVAGVPLITLCGVASAIFDLWLIWSLITNSALGSNSPTGLGSLVVLLGLGVVLYMVARVRASRAGIDLSLAAKEIPPE